jgi:hypothetical protein
MRQFARSLIEYPEKIAGISCFICQTWLTSYITLSFRWMDLNSIDSLAKFVLIANLINSTGYILLGLFRDKTKASRLTRLLYGLFGTITLAVTIFTFYTIFSKPLT